MINKQMVIAIASGKGGTGKTFLAVSLASWLAQQQELVLLDLDVEEPNAGIYLKKRLEERMEHQINVPQVSIDRCVLCGACARKCNFNAISFFGTSLQIHTELCMGCGRCQHNCPHGALFYEKQAIGMIQRYATEDMTFTEGVLHPGNIHTKVLISKVKQTAKGELIIIDCPPGTTCPMIAAVRDASFVVLVTEPTPFGLQDLSLAVSLVEDLKLPFGVVINKAGENDSLITSFCQERNIHLLGRVPFSTDIARKCSKGRLELDASSMQHIFESIKKQLGRGAA